MILHTCGTFKRETLEAVSALDGASSQDEALARWRHMRLSRRVALPGMPGNKANTGLRHVGIELPWGETRRDTSGVSLRGSAVISMLMTSDLLTEH